MINTVLMPDIKNHIEHPAENRFVVYALFVKINLILMHAPYQKSWYVQVQHKLITRGNFPFVPNHKVHGVWKLNWLLLMRFDRVIDRLKLILYISLSRFFYFALKSMKKKLYMKKQCYSFMSVGQFCVLAVVEEKWSNRVDGTRTVDRLWHWRRTYWSQLTLVYTLGSEKSWKKKFKSNSRSAHRFSIDSANCSEEQIV